MIRCAWGFTPTPAVEGDNFFGKLCQCLFAMNFAGLSGKVYRRICESKSEYGSGERSRNKYKLPMPVHMNSPPLPPDLSLILTPSLRSLPECQAKQSIASYLPTNQLPLPRAYTLAFILSPILSVQFAALQDHLILSALVEVFSLTLFTVLIP